MPDVTVRKLDDLECYDGPGAIDGIRFRAAGRQLGVSAWGMSVIDIEPGCADYPEHDHAADGQEEVYVVLRGEAVLHVADHAIPLDHGTMARVAPHERRKIVAGPSGVRVLAIGAAVPDARQDR